MRSSLLCSQGHREPGQCLKQLHEAAVLLSCAVCVLINRVLMTVFIVSTYLQFLIVIILFKL